MKRTWLRKSWLWAFIFALSFFAGTDIYADDKKGSCGDQAGWVLHDDGILEISGTGMISFPASDYTDSVKAVIVHEGITSIDDCAFLDFVKLESVKLPESLKQLGESVFSGCSSLKEIVLPEKITMISTGLFADCKNLKNVVIPDSVTRIKTCAFRGCENLVINELPDSVFSIEEDAFRDCRSISEFRISERVKFIEFPVFSGCDRLKVLEVSRNNSVYDSRDNCNAIIDRSTNTLLAGCAATVIPESVRRIGTYAFLDCRGLQSIVISDNVTSLEEYAFMGCTGLAKAVLPDGLTDIGEGIFMGCTGLTEINLPERLEEIPGSMFSDCSLLRSIKIPEGVKKIGDSAFWECYSLESIEIPASVSEIEVWVFYGCTGLEKISVNSSNKYYDSRNNCNAIIQTNGSRLLFGCNNSRIPSDITGIASGAFYGCSNLGEIEIPASVIEIGNEAFTNSFSKVSVAKDNPVYDSRKNCNAIIITADNELMAGCANTVIPSGITSIGFSAFRDCTGLTRLKIPDGVERIDFYAFSGCSNLTTIIIPKSVTEMDDSTFYSCNKLSDLYYQGDEEAWDTLSWYGELFREKHELSVHILYAGDTPTEVYRSLMHSPFDSYRSMVRMLMSKA